MTQQLLQINEPDYYAVIFTSIKTQEAIANPDYGDTNDTLDKEAQQISGFLGMESVRDGLGISISYWKDLDSIQQWRTNLSHIAAKQKGFSEWYSAFTIRICKIEYQRNFEK